MRETGRAIPWRQPFKTEPPFPAAEAASRATVFLSWQGAHKAAQRATRTAQGRPCAACAAPFDIVMVTAAPMIPCRHSGAGSAQNSAVKAFGDSPGPGPPLAVAGMRSRPPPARKAPARGPAASAHEDDPAECDLLRPAVSFSPLQPALTPPSRPALSSAGERDYDFLLAQHRLDARRSAPTHSLQTPDSPRAHHSHQQPSASQPS